MIPEELLKETENRFSARKQEREETKANMEIGGVAQANEPAQVRMRLERVGVEAPVDAQGAILITPEVAGSHDPVLERILGNNDLLGVAYLDIATRVTRCIVCVRLRQNGCSLGSGTGFMVSPSLLMTNNHVLSGPEIAQESFVEFDYEDDADGVRRRSILFDLEPRRFFITDKTLDYSLVAVKPVSRDGQTLLSSFGWLPLLSDDAMVLKGEPLSIIQHPNGEPKQVALRANELVDILEQFLHYSTDTAPGSSGSPVFNNQWEVVALHHSGVPERDDQKRILTRGGGLWSPEMGDQWVHWIANEGVRISLSDRAHPRTDVDGPGRTLTPRAPDRRHPPRSPPTDRARGANRAAPPRLRWVLRRRLSQPGRSNRWPSPPGRALRPGRFRWRSPCASGSPG